MRLFFPSFFIKLSSVELDYLKVNENWVLDIFGEFWGILMKNIEKTENLCTLRPFGNELLFPDVLQASPPSDAPLNIVPLFVSESGWNPIRDARPFVTSPVSVDPQLKMFPKGLPLLTLLFLPPRFISLLTH
jgi:hypothetical protein